MIPLLWEMGAKLAEVDATFGGKSALAKGKDNYRRSILVFNHFRTLDSAKNCGGSLRDVLTAAWKSLKGRGLSTVRMAAAAIETGLATEVQRVRGLYAF